MGLFRKISLGLQITSLFTYIVGFVALKTANSKKKGIFKHGKINSVGYLLGFISLLYMAYSALNLIVSRKVPAAVFIHGPLGALTLTLSSLFVANRWSWKTIKNMRSFVAFWLLTFTGGLYLFSLLKKDH
jgi:hypothetical protein